jgi:hypothetical protein
MKVRIVEELSNEELEALEDDYPSTQSTNMNFKKIANNAVKKFLKHIPLWDDAQIHYSDNIGNVLGKHRAESESHPIIILSPKNIKRAFGQYKGEIDLDTIIETTVWHELGHSFYEYCAIHDLPLPQNEEKFAEGIAHELWDYFSIPDYAEKLLKKVQELEK